MSLTSTVVSAYLPIWGARHLSLVAVNVDKVNTRSYKSCLFVPKGIQYTYLEIWVGFSSVGYVVQHVKIQNTAEYHYIVGRQRRNKTQIERGIFKMSTA